VESENSDHLPLPEPAQLIDSDGGRNAGASDRVGLLDVEPESTLVTEEKAPCPAGETKDSKGFEIGPGLTGQENVHPEIIDESGRRLNPRS